MNLIEKLKNTAHKASEDFILSGVDMNDTILNSCIAGDIDNAEILKRVCELANQNVYLSLFQGGEDKKNITFPIADFNKLEEEFQKSEKAMDSYSTPPTDFRSLLAVVIGQDVGDIQQAPSNGEKLAEFQKLGNYRNAFEAFISDIESLRYSEMQSAEYALSKMAHDTKIMVSNGESIGDISKVAIRFVKEAELDPMKIAMAYDIIHRDLVSDGYSVKTNFTKVSSYRINEEAEMLKPVNELSLSLEKIAASTEMISNLTNTMNAFNKVLREELINQEKK